MGVDRHGAERMAGKARHLLVKLEGVGLRAALVLKQDLLSLGGDAALAREAAALSVPRTPVLLMGTARQLADLARKCEAQPFGLAGIGRSLAALLAASPPRFVVGRRDLLRAGGPLVMGILNVTPDSFSDGGRWFDPGAAVDHGARMAAGGADIVDVGGESTRPGSARVSPAEEERRVVPVVRGLRRAGVKVVSVDTTRAKVAAAALDAGASVVNDVSGLSRDRGMARAVARAGASLVVMHTRGTPATMSRLTGYRDLAGEVYAGLAAAVGRAGEAGIPLSRVAVDPGIGFAKTAEQSLSLLARVGELRSLGCAVAVGASRKSFLGFAGAGETPADRLSGSLAAAAAAVLGGADIVRVHDVPQTAQALAVAREVRRWRG